MIGKYKFKNIKLDRIPQGWELIRLSDISKIKDGDWILKEDYTIHGSRLLQIGDIGIGAFLNKSNRFISIERARELNCTFINPENDILISRMPEPIGRACLAPILRYPYIVAVDISILKVDKTKVSRQFLVYLLNSNKILRKVKKISSGATRLRISRKKLEELLILFPPLPEQKKIAEVLSTIDHSIEEVDESITKTERLKKGLMQELLTKGIGHKEFKETEIGKLPEEWKVVKVSDIANVKGGKRLPKGHNLVDFKTPYPYIRVMDFSNMSVDTTNIKFLLPETQKEIKRYTISHDNVYISIAGSVGLAGLIPVELEGANLTENSAKLCNLRKVAKNFLAYALNYSIVQKQIHSFVGKAQQPKLALFRIEKIKIPLPPLPEQKKITEILSTVDDRIQLLKDKKNKLVRVKKGLMNELLTGRKRVKVEA